MPCLTIEGSYGWWFICALGGLMWTYDTAQRVPHASSYASSSKAHHPNHWGIIGWVDACVDLVIVPMTPGSHCLELTRGFRVRVREQCSWTANVQCIRKTAVLFLKKKLQITGIPTFLIQRRRFSKLFQRVHPRQVLIWACYLVSAMTWWRRLKIWSWWIAQAPNQERTSVLKWAEV